MRKILVNSVVRMLLLVSVMGLSASTLFAADPLTGRLDPSKTKSSNPTQTTYRSIANGISRQVGQGKPTDFIWDGQDRPVGASGTITNVVRVSDHTFVITNKQDGKATSKLTVTASDDGKHLTTVSEILAGPSKQTMVANRVGSAPAGDAFLGTWQPDPSQTKYETPSTVTFKVDGDTLDYTMGMNHVFTEKFDGKDHKDDAGNTTVRLTRIDANTIEILLNPPSGITSTTQWQVKGDMLIRTSNGTNQGKPSKTVLFYERVK